MEKIVTQGLLYDFYGELLTAHQKKIYEDFVYHDLSLSEIAGEYQISRQAAHDLIKRCDRTLQKYEERLGLVERFRRIREKIENLNQYLKQNLAQYANQDRLPEGNIADLNELTKRVNEIFLEILADL